MAGSIVETVGEFTDGRVIFSGDRAVVAAAGVVAEDVGVASESLVIIH